MVRLRHRIEVAISDDSFEDKNLGKSVFSIVTDALGEGGSWKTKVLGGAVDQSIPLLNVASIKALFMVTSANDVTVEPSTIFVKFNSILATPIEIAPLVDSNSKEAYFLIHTNNLTAIFVSNPGTVNMDIRVFAAGD